jgi:asparagine synthase (glutamine-hydrolysing)
MSVQLGIWNLDGAPVTRDSLTRIGESLKDFGPDGEATYIQGSIGLLYRPFHTTAESRLECQPRHSAKGMVITWDGRLDNRDELVPQLYDTQQDDGTDVAIVAAAFDHWGTDSFVKLIGDWAITVWDPHNRELILARDYIGIKHLFFYPRPNTIKWSTHLLPLVCCGDQFTLCEDYISGYLAFHPDAHLTPYREVQSVPPGKFVRICKAKVSTHTYWGFNPRLKTRHRTDEEYEEHYRYVFRQAVRRRLRADSPILAELSGGLDSSSMVCMGDDILAKEGAGTPRIDTFSYYDSAEPGEDDFLHFTRVESKRGRTGFRADLKASGESLALGYPTFVATPGFAHRTEVHSALTDVLRQHRYRAILSGTGGDEMNGQPLDPTIHMADLLCQFRLIRLVRELMAWSPRVRIPWIQLLLQAVVQLLPVALRIRFTTMGRVEPWVNCSFARSHSIAARQLEVTQGTWFLRPSIRDAVQTIATLSRRMTYASPSIIERRYPYLDQTLVEFLTSVPIDQLIRPGQRRSLMRRALADLLPPEIVSRKTKASAIRCYSLVLEKQWDVIDDAFRSPLSEKLGYVTRDQTYAALVAMKDGQVPMYFLRLLKALSLELWLREAAKRHVISVEDQRAMALAQAS